MPALGQAEFGALTFCAASHPNDKCGANGLPLTPNSIRVFGRFQELKSLEHPRLCKYLDLVRSKHERVIIVAEHYKDNLELAIKEHNSFKEDGDIVQLAFEVLEGLSYMNKHGLVHRNLEPGNVLLDKQGQVKLTQHGMYYMTDFGTAVSFPIGKPRYMAPEVLAQGPLKLIDGSLNPLQPPSGPKVDVWSLGMILVETILGGKLWPTLTIQQIFFKILRFLKTDTHPLDIIVKDHNAEDKFKSVHPDVATLLKACLTVCVNKRVLPSELMHFSVFKKQNEQLVSYPGNFDMFSIELRCKDLEIEPFDEDKVETEEHEDHLSERSIEEVYYMWQLAGGDLETVLKKEGLIRTKPPIMNVSSFVTENGDLFGQEREKSYLFDDTIVVMSQEQLRDRLKNIDEYAYYPLLEEEQSKSTRGLPTSPSSVDLSDTTNLPLVIKEKDIEHQFHRVILYERLLKAYPYKRAHIWQEARVDIPPLVRPLVWAALLEVEGDVKGRYDSIDKETPIATDRQIEVDVPRCHQYNELFSSPDGHGKFKRILKAWVVSHPEYVYWQGLDSLCAPFLHLNFNIEALAFACLDAFIPKYLHKFFLKDNSKVIQEYLAVFSHLIAFHEPELSNHLDGIGFIPDLYAIPWFLTMYAHVFPLHKIFHLWDTLLLGNSSFPLCIGVSILLQLKDQLLSFGFNECILLFSDMPGVNIEQCVKDSIKIFCTTPKSATYREHARPPRSQKENKPSRPNISYYSQDYHDQPKSDLSMEPIPLEDLKSEKCPRISAEDLIELTELTGHSPTRSPTKKTQASKPKIVMVDVRMEEEYMRGTLPGAINIPFSTAFSPDGELLPTPAVQKLNASKFLVKVIIGGRGKNDVHFAEAIVRLNYSKVCVLHKGIEVMRSTGYLTVPPPEL